VSTFLCKRTNDKTTNPNSNLNPELTNHPPLQIQTLSSSPSSSSPKKPVLIDVREPGELASTGRIPGAINIPITTSPDSFHLSPADFEDRFGFAPPDKEGDELVLYCKAGVRSRAAAGLAREAGFKNVGEYPGSWIEWSGKGGEVER